ncbi:NGFI-A-binding protein 2 isoform X2 [Protopterus annectens]|uniref:NGFI-A-binding protein 2 isoform X2 n=1 Tax=Protopterus annectens TaxID=7888 RepID=UPI001CFB5E11|nr:NGFI-A-binding protein 2 isoform X2 [Protopterus annectens]
MLSLISYTEGESGTKERARVNKSEGSSWKSTARPVLGSTVMSLPRTLGELQLYRVLQRANLLAYYDTFIQQGGDDVQQLCEAGEEEFLEIMALVGMATKPLHVRRLQKALREWATNPTLFNQSVGSMPVNSIPLFKISEAVGRKALTNGHANSPDGQVKGLTLTSVRSFSPKSPSDIGEKLSPLQVPQDARLWQGRSTPEPDGSTMEDEQASPLTSTENSSKLDSEVIQMISESVDRLMNTLQKSDPSEVKDLLKLNKKLAKSVGHIFEMDDQDSLKEEEIRKSSIIYGRFDSKRREGKQLTQHELMINEAAAQFCMRENSLLLRRVELFSLARQVARECTYISSLKCSRLNPDDITGPQAKKAKREVGITEHGVSSHQHTESLRQSNSDLYISAYRHCAEEDNASLSGESLDGHGLQGSAPCTRLSPSSPKTSSDITIHLPPHSSWSRHLLQQTLMDEGLRLARLVSHERIGRLSPCPQTAKAQITELENGTLDAGQVSSIPPAATAERRKSTKEEQETNRQHYP